MKRAALIMATTAILVTAGAVLSPTAALAASGPLAGTWTSVDNDGSTQTLAVTGTGRHAYSMVYVDEIATSACGGDPAMLSGPGFVQGEDVLMVGSLVCVPGGNPVRSRLAIFFDYDSGADTLTDGFGIVWTRTA